MDPLALAVVRSEIAYWQVVYDKVDEDDDSYPFVKAAKVFADAVNEQLDDDVSAAAPMDLATLFGAMRTMPKTGPGRHS